MTVPWSKRAEQAEHMAKCFRVIAAEKPMRTFERKSAFMKAKRCEREAAEFRRKMDEWRSDHA